MGRSGTGAAAELGGAAEVVVQRMTNYLMAHPEILAGALEGIIKSNFGPDTEMSSSVVNNFFMNLGMNSGEAAAYLEILLRSGYSNKKK